MGFKYKFVRFKICYLFYFKLYIIEKILRVKILGVEDEILKRVVRKLFVEYYFEGISYFKLFFCYS